MLVVENDRAPQISKCIQASIFLFQTPNHVQPISLSTLLTCSWSAMSSSKCSGPKSCHVMRYFTWEFWKSLSGRSWVPVGRAMAQGHIHQPIGCGSKIQGHQILTLLSSSVLKKPNRLVIFRLSVHFWHVLASFGNSLH